MDLQLSGQVAVVTGSSRGIGASIARTLAQEGVSVVVNYARDRESAETVGSAIEVAGGRASVFQADVSIPAEAQALIDHALNRFGRLDILVNNAGIMFRSPFLQTPLEELNRVMATNLGGAWNCCQAAAEHMVRARYGRILICSSGGAILPIAGQAAYGASKAALLVLNRILASELAPYNVMVNAYVPGSFETDMSRSNIASRGSTAFDTIALRRAGQPDEIGPLVAFLVSPLNSYMTGEAVVANGGKFAVQNPMKPWRDAGLPE